MSLFINPNPNAHNPNKAGTKQATEITYNIFCGDLHPDVDEEILFELFTQVANVVNVNIIRDPNKSFAFVCVKTEAEMEYAINVLRGTSLFGIPLRLNRSDRDKNSLDVGANLFIGNLSPAVDERMLLDTFLRFGGVIDCRVQKEKNSAVGFVKYECFESADLAIEMMNGQFFCDSVIRVEYSYKSDSSSSHAGSREKHGSQEERQLAALNPRVKMAQKLLPKNIEQQQMQLQLLMQQQIQLQQPPMQLQQPTMPQPHTHHQHLQWRRQV